MYHPRTLRRAVRMHFHATYTRSGTDSKGGDCEKNDCNARGLHDVSCYINPSTGASGPTEARA